MPTVVLPGALGQRGFPTPYLLSWPTKLSGDRDCYTLDVTNWLAAVPTLSGVPDVLISVAVAETPATTPALAADTVGIAGSLASAWVTGGTAGQTYTLAFTLTTFAGRILTVQTTLAVAAGLTPPTVGQTSNGAGPTMVLYARSVGGQPVSLTTDGTGVVSGSNGLPVRANSAARFAGRWQVKNTDNADTIGGDFSVVASRGAGIPALGTASGGAAVSTFDLVGTTLAGAPPIAISVDQVNAAVAFTWPGYAGLTCDVRVFVDDNITF